MRKFLITIICFIVLAESLYANHITGGEIYYTYTGRGDGTYQYHVTLKLFRDCSLTASGSPLNDIAEISVFERGNGIRIVDISAPRSQTETLEITHFDPCITDPPSVCFEVAYFEYDINLPASAKGYVIVHQNCCRRSGLANVRSTSGTSFTGAIYTAEIPGTVPLANAPVNNSARFTGADTVIVCSGNYFTYASPAFDADGDRLVYSFSEALAGTPHIDGFPPQPDRAQGIWPADSPPFGEMLYGRGFSGATPMGPGIRINSATGTVSGIAPASGIYVITVLVSEIRNGVIIATQRKDIQVKVSDCQIARAFLYPQYINCDSSIVQFQNLSNSPLIRTYNWDFGVSTLTTDTSSLAQPVFNFPDTGSYTIKLVTNRNQFCADSTTSVVKIFPGFTPGFTNSGVCLSNPIMYRDTSRTVYGFVDSWEWDLGDIWSDADISQLPNPVWTYRDTGYKDVRLIVTTNKGCIDTVEKTIHILLKPLITLAFRDTLICTPDPLQLLAGGAGIFSWTPLINIANANTATPTVNPVTTTWYYIDLDEFGCHNRDTVRVRVVDHVTLTAHADTTICRTDSVQLGANSDGLRFLWSPSGTLNNPTLASPFATPLATSTVYQVVGRIGSCSATDDMIVTTVPYPRSDAGNGDQICYNTTTQLHGSYTGSSFSWSPAAYVNDPHNLDPVVKPPRSTTFLLSVYDTLGCPKPGRDSVIVNVFPKLNITAGHDTSVVVGQPLQLNTGGGVSYQWTPSTGLNNPAISNPVGIYASQPDEINYKIVITDQTGCSDSAFIKVTVFKTNPYVFVPTAFTPNHDGLNDLIRPIPVGVQKINYFSIYDRWGQLMFNDVSGQGWDGTVGGKPQGSGVFVWMLSAIDYTGKPIFLKGTLTLIR